MLGWRHGSCPGGRTRCPVLVLVAMVLGWGWQWRWGNSRRVCLVFRPLESVVSWNGLNPSTCQVSRVWPGRCCPRMGRGLQGTGGQEPWGTSGTQQTRDSRDQWRRWGGGAGAAGWGGPTPSKAGRQEAEARGQAGPCQGGLRRAPIGALPQPQTV